MAAELTYLQNQSPVRGRRRSRSIVPPEMQQGMNTFRASRSFSPDSGPRDYMVWDSAAHTPCSGSRTPPMSPSPMPADIIDENLDSELPCSKFAFYFSCLNPRYCPSHTRL